MNFKRELGEGLSVWVTKVRINTFVTKSSLKILLQKFRRIKILKFIRKALVTRFKSVDYNMHICIRLVPELFQPQQRIQGRHNEV